MSSCLKLIPIAMLAIGFWMTRDTDPNPGPSPDPTPIVVNIDVFSLFVKAQRAEEVAMLRELAADDSDNTQEKLDRVVSARDAIRLKTQEVYTDAIAEAVFAKTLNELADEIEGGK